MFLALLPAASLAFTPNNNQQSQRSIRESKALNLYRSATEAIAEAERVCAEEGPDSERCRVAWDIVEELEAADSRARTVDDGPRREEYAPLVQGLDILTGKLERKLDELKALSEQLTAVGAGPEVERLMYASDEMKQILKEASDSMDMYR